jgi:hypothetical protein
MTDGKMTIIEMAHDKMTLYRIANGGRTHGTMTFINDTWLNDIH